MSTKHSVKADQQTPRSGESVLTSINGVVAWSTQGAKVRVYNATGGTTYRGQVVYILANNQYHLASINDLSADKPLGIIDDDSVGNGGFANILMVGPGTVPVARQGGTAWAAGDSLYIGIAAGVLTNVQPTADGARGYIGEVVVSGTTADVAVNVAAPHAPLASALTSAANVVTIAAYAGPQYHLANLAETTEIQVPTGGRVGDHLYVTIDQDGTGYAVTFAAALINIGTQSVASTANAKCLVTLIARDFGSGIEWVYFVTRFEPPSGIVTLTSAANVVAVDASLGHDFKLNTLAENTVFQVPTNAVEGDSYTITLEQDSVGGRTVGFAAGYVNVGQLDPPLLADSYCVISVAVRDFGSGIEYAYAVSHSQEASGVTAVDATLTTSDNTLQTIASFVTLNDDSVYIVEGRVTGVDAAGDVSYTRLFESMYFRDGGSTVTQDDQLNLATNSSAPAEWDATMSFSGTTLLVQVRGDSTNDVNFRFVGTVTEVIG